MGISYRVDGRWLRAVRGFSLTIHEGEIYGLVGESGSGKSTAALGVMRYLPPNGRTEAGSVTEFLGEDLAPKSAGAMRELWGAQMAMVPQNPGAALNPSIRVGEQVAEIAQQHMGMGSAAAREAAVEALRRVNLADPERLIRRYPHQLSGGMQQRVVIAMALITSPALLVLDEPTTSLDVTTEAVILDLVRDLVHQQGNAALYVTHNLGVVAQLCERVAVMYAGEIMEDGPVEALFADPVHPYTIGLLRSIPRVGQTKHDAALLTIPGRPPSLQELPAGCVYRPRCALAIEVCQEKPPLTAGGAHRLVRCHRWEDIASGAVKLDAEAEEGQRADLLQKEQSDALLRVVNLAKHFPVRRGLGELIRGEEPEPVRAVDGVNLGIRPGRTYGLVGESGSGKTTLARVIIGLTQCTGGEMELLGAEIAGDVHGRTKETLAQLQMVFQNPQTSLNPYLTVGQAIRRPLMKLAGLKRGEADQEVARLLDAVNLRGEYATRYPGELSGGEKQRVAIARAFASEPALVICDEPVTSLDVSVQASVLNLLARLQEERGSAYLFISHDLAVVGYLADYLAVMYLGVLFEVGYARDMFAPPLHPYTEALVSAIPVADPSHETDHIRLEGEVPSARRVPSGCRFHTRCPRKIGAVCEDEVPPWRDDGEAHYIRCHIPLAELVELQQGIGRQVEGDA